MHKEQLPIPKFRLLKLTIRQLLKARSTFTKSHFLKKYTVFLLGKKTQMVFMAYNVKYMCVCVRVYITH